MSNKYPHYHKNVEGLKTVDVYRVLSLWNVSDPAIQHAIKKLLNAGERGMKDWQKDLREAIDSIERALEMREEDGRKPAVPAPYNPLGIGQPLPAAPSDRLAEHEARLTAAPPAPSQPAPMPTPAPVQEKPATARPAGPPPYEQGRAARRAGMLYNPYKIGTVESSAWEKGYDDEKEGK